MKRRLVITTFMVAILTTAMAQKTFNVNISNASKVDKTSVPVIIPLDKYDIEVKSATVMNDGKEIPCQLDDTNQDGAFDELCFVTDMAQKSNRSFVITLEEKGSPRQYVARTYAEMVLPNKKVKAKNKQDIFISDITVDRGSATSYSSLHHHGPAFENEYIAFRLYFDHRQTVDMYGKKKKGLEIRETQFYPDEKQKAEGYGDDVLWVGDTFGLGALRGWDGTGPTMFDDCDHRTMRLIASGPVRAIVEVVDRGWNTRNAGKEPIDMTTRYTLFAGRRDCAVDISFRKPATGYEFSTGIINVKGSEEMTDRHGLRGCWGTDWPVALKDSAGHKRETVGLGIYVPEKYIIKELPKNKDNYPYVVGNADKKLHYYINFCSDNETFGYHSAKEWFDYLKQWRKELDAPVTITF